LEAEKREYEALLDGQFDLAALHDLERLGQNLIRARICSHLTHKDLADALGNKEQAIQRLEATDYSTASLATLATIANAIIGLQRRAD
jgi:HTH-type transcriptional regulator/antitoxin HigA